MRQIASILNSYENCHLSNLVKYKVNLLKLLYFLNKVKLKKQNSLFQNFTQSPTENTEFPYQNKHNPQLIENTEFSL
jgi:hypothetical protein